MHVLMNKEIPVQHRLVFVILMEQRFSSYVRVMTKEERLFVNDLIRASIFDIVKSNEIDKFIEDSIFVHKDDVTTVYENVKKVLPHNCNPYPHLQSVVSGESWEVAIFFSLSYLVQ